MGVAIAPVVVVVVLVSIVVVVASGVVVVSGVGLTTFALTLKAGKGSFEAREFGGQAHL